MDKSTKSSKLSKVIILSLLIMTFPICCMAKKVSVWTNSFGDHIVEIKIFEYKDTQDIKQIPEEIIIMQDSYVVREQIGISNTFNLQEDQYLEAIATPLEETPGIVLSIHVEDDYQFSVSSRDKAKATLWHLPKEKQ